jgi:hypothetical protein
LCSIQVLSEGNTVNHTSAINKLAWYYLQCSVMGASNS